MVDSDPLIVIGLDGATWKLLDPWIEDGELPTIKRLRAESTWGPLEVCQPPVTSPSWKCYSSGKNPGKLGVYWWEIVDVENQEIRLPDSNSYRSAEVWDYIGASGQSWAAVNMPTTFPPHGGDNNGVMISGSTADATQEYTSPASLKSELESAINYYPSPKKSIDEAGAIKEIYDLIEKRFDAAMWLLENKNLDFLHLTVFLSNKLHHYFWDDEQTLKGWKLIDEKLESFIDEGYDLLFISDHGSNEITTEFQVNTWLEQEGYLVRDTDKKRKDNIATRLRLTPHQLSKITARLNIRSVLRKIVPQRVTNLLPQGNYKKSDKLSVINWEATQAIASGQGLIYLTEPWKEDADQITNEITEKLDALKDFRTGEPITDGVHRKREVYSGDYLNLAPDIVFEQAPGIHTDDLVGAPSVFTDPSGWRGENDQVGIFMAHGPSFEANGRREDIHILNIMPTILRLLNIPIPVDTDRDPLKILSHPEDHPINHQDPMEPPSRGTKEPDGVEDKLRELGYLN